MILLDKGKKKMFNLKKSQNQLNEQLNEAIEMLNNLQVEIPIDAVPEQIIAMAEQMQQAVPKIENASNNIGQIGEMQEQIGQQMLQNRNQIAAKTNIFNLKKAQEFDPGMAPVDFNNTPEMMGDQLETQDQMMQTTFKFKNHIELKNWLDTTDAKTVDNLLRENGAPDAKEIVDYYYMQKTNVEKGLISEEELVDEADRIFEILPLSLKEEGGEIMAPYTQGASQAIQKIAKANIKKETAKPYNLKTAQHKAFDNIIMYGPQEKRMDPFLRQPVSDQHILERNKGFGLVVDDVWNIDWETVWRENVMDKYSRPYRDKDGNWVGGYIQKRFEVDKNIPETSNMQLKPGQRRKPRLPEYGLTESRLQAARAAGDIEGGPEVDRTEPFNWKTAQVKKKVK